MLFGSLNMISAIQSLVLFKSALEINDIRNLLIDTEIAAPISDVTGTIISEFSHVTNLYSGFTCFDRSLEIGSSLVLEELI